MSYDPFMYLTFRISKPQLTVTQRLRIKRKYYIQYFFCIFSFPFLSGCSIQAVLAIEHFPSQNQEWHTGKKMNFCSLSNSGIFPEYFVTSIFEEGGVSIKLTRMIPQLWYHSSHARGLELDKLVRMHNIDSKAL